MIEKLVGSIRFLCREIDGYNYILPTPAPATPASLAPAGGADVQFASSKTVIIDKIQ